MISSIFRTVHTIKGTCGFLGFGRLEGVAHAGENLLSQLRDRTFAPNSEIIDALLATADALRHQLAGIERDGAEPDDDHAALREWLHRLQDGERVPRPAALLPFGARVLEQNVATAASTALDAPVADETPEIEPPIVELDEASPSAPVAVPVAASAPVAATAEARRTDDDRAAAGTVADSTIRVDVGLLDTLMNLIGELVLARNQIVQLASVQHDGSLLAPSQRLNQITSELQEAVMKTRMQPIGTLWQRLPRVVRDLAMSCEKRVRVRVRFEGAETELDRTILEAIKDPLTHLVRNAIDHGLEGVDERVQRGKDAEGVLTLRAYHESGKVNIAISDDGHGIDPSKIRAKAIDKGLVTAEAAQNLSDREVLNFIFAPGFSTAEAVTNISGRGVGMDVVRTNVEKIGGAIELSSELGHGTTFRVKIPLTLAIIPALVVLSRGQRYAIPQVNLAELVRVDGSDPDRRIEYLHGAPVYRLRGRLLPIIDLTDLLRGGTGAVRSGAPGAAANIVVVQADDHQFGLIVDSVFDTQEIVVKPLSKLLKDADIYAGATVMGDGKIALILDAIGVARRAGLAGRSSAPAPTAADAALDTDMPRYPLVVVDAGGVRAAVPLADIARLEQFDASKIEHSRGNNVVQYRDRVMTLIDLAHAVPEAAYGSIADAGPVPVLVLNNGRLDIGVTVNGIVDIVEATVLDTPTSDFVMGTALVDGKVTDIVDAKAFAQALTGSFDEPAIDVTDTTEVV